MPHQSTAAELRAEVEATPSHQARVLFRELIGRPLRRTPPPSWTPAIVAGCCLALAACVVVWRLRGPASRRIGCDGVPS